MQLCWIMGAKNILLLAAIVEQLEEKTMLPMTKKAMVLWLLREIMMPIWNHFNILKENSKLVYCSNVAAQP